jgi:hypothetical protein
MHRRGGVCWRETPRWTSTGDSNSGTPRRRHARLKRHDGDMREWIAAEPQGFRGAGRIADVRLPARLQEQGAWLALDGSPTSCRVPMSASRNSSHETSDGWFAAFSDSNRVIVVLGRMLTAQSGPPTALSSCQRRRQIACGQLMSPGARGLVTESLPRGQGGRSITGMSAHSPSCALIWARRPTDALSRS